MGRQCILWTPRSNHRSSRVRRDPGGKRYIQNLISLMITGFTTSSVLKCRSYSTTSGSGCGLVGSVSPWFGGGRDQDPAAAGEGELNCYEYRLRRVARGSELAHASHHAVVVY